jgi:excisionase family DNA binding protein
MVGHELLTADEVAARLKIAKRTVLRWSREGRLECVRISAKVVLLPAEAVDRFVHGRTFEVESKAGKREGAGRGQSAPNSRKGVVRKKSGESWRDLRQEVSSWEY